MGYSEMRKALKISGNASEILSVSLNAILNCIDNIENINWGLLWIEAVAKLENGESVPDFERKVNYSEAVTIFTSEKLLKFSVQIIQSIGLLIIGDNNKESIRRYSTDQEMFSSCDYTIELIDSSYWVIHSKNIAFLRNISEKLPGVESFDC